MPRFSAMCRLGALAILATLVGRARAADEGERRSAALPLSDRIDARLSADWSRLGVAPARRADDREFPPLTLDLVNRTPRGRSQARPSARERSTQVVPKKRTTPPGKRGCAVGRVHLRRWRRVAGRGLEPRTCGL